MWDINEAHFRRVDLNTLIVFMAVMRERSVTKASERLLIGQPAVSHALGRLRALFDDPLFVRSKNGMVPTPRAEAAFARLSVALTEVHDTVFDPPEFNPILADDTIRIGLPDDLDMVLVPDLIRRLAKDAPNIKLVVRPANFRTIPDQIDDEDIDVAVSAKPVDVRTWHTHKTLRSEGFKCIFDPSQIGAQRRLTMKTYLSGLHVIVSQNGELHGAIDEQLEARGLNRRTVMAAARFATLPGILKEGPFIANMPETCAALFAKKYDLRVCDLPFETPRFDLAIVYPERYATSPVQAWFRELLEVSVLETHGKEDD